MSAPEGLPLNSPLVPTGFPRLWRLADNPELLVREEGDTKSLEELSQVKPLLNELEDDYGIKSPGYYPFIADDTKDGHSRPFVVVQKIHGTNLESAIDSGNLAVLKATSQLYDSLATYVSDKSTRDEEIMSDIFGNHQYMWGRVDGETEDSIYLTDVGGMMSRFKDFASDFPDRKPNTIMNYALYVFGDVMELAEKTGQPAPAATLNKVYDILDNNTAYESAVNKALAEINRARKVGQTASGSVVDLLFQD